MAKRLDSSTVNSYVCHASGTPWSNNCPSPVNPSHGLRSLPHLNVVEFNTVEEVPSMVHRGGTGTPPERDPPSLQTQISIS
ncbi:hypothetical protein M8818_000330 [Zalaria obscura]|uniref:Uncharacterized protein n=1 Tax=Zalaria obscura TaxID=2024903 RepID=A0ACC3SN28_9PEZI